MNRRNFLSALGASIAAMFVGKLPSAKAGVPGVTYFLAPHKHRKEWYDLPPGTRLFLDGRDVTDESDEADLIQGWVRCYEVKERYPLGTPKTFIHDSGWIRQRLVFGKVELRPGFRP